LTQYPCADTEPTTVEVEMKVEGMMCDGCSGRIEEALKVS
jgi:hypothetical protein